MLVYIIPGAYCVVMVFVVIWSIHEEAFNGFLLSADDATNKRQVEFYLQGWNHHFDVADHAICFCSSVIFIFELFHFQYVKLTIERWFPTSSGMVYIYMMKWVVIYTITVYSHTTMVNNKDKEQYLWLLSLVICTVNNSSHNF